MNLDELKKDARYLALGNENNSTDYPDTPLVRNINYWYDQVDSWCWRNDSTWQFDDSNKDTLPIAIADLIDKQQDYAIPSDARTVDMATVKAADGNEHRLRKLDESQIAGAPAEYLETPGLPQAYDMKGRSIFLYPPPSTSDVTAASGLKLYLSRSITPLSASGDVPGFDRNFHRILSIGAAMDYCVANGLASKEVDLRRMIFGGETTPGLKRELETFYGRRNEEFKSRIIPKREPYE